MTAAPRIIYMRCTENRVEDDYDGGIVLLQAVAGQPNTDLVDARVVMSFTHDDPMCAFPIAREEKQARVWRVTLEECTLDDLPAADA